VHLEDEAGNILSEIRGGESFTVKLAMGNSQNEEKRYFGAVALYAKTGDSQKELIKIHPFSPVVPACTGTKAGQYSLAVPFDMNGQSTKPEYSIKVLLWTEDGRLTPTEIPGAGKAIG